MNDTLTLLLAGLAGVVLGAVFFAGLWWTVQRGMASRRPGLWFGGSLLVRTALVLAGMYFAADRNWRRLGMCLLGFALARLLVMYQARPPTAPQSSRVTPAGHAP
jgi:F1F0 ATPase subunit 2